jgi:hypothetical protein
MENSPGDGTVDPGVKSSIGKGMVPPDNGKSDPERKAWIRHRNLQSNDREAGCQK